MFHRHFVSKQWRNLRMISLECVENARTIHMKISVIAEFITEAFLGSRVTYGDLAQSFSFFFFTAVDFANKFLCQIVYARSFIITSTTHITINHRNIVDLTKMIAPLYIQLT